MLIVKIGGGKNVNWDAVAVDVAKLLKKRKVVLVHGASETRDGLARKLGHETKYLTAPSGQVGVYTDKKAIEILTMAYAGLVNKKVVAVMQKNEINAVGLSGADGRIWEGSRKKNLLSLEKGKTKLIKNTYTGRVEKVNAELINLLAGNGFLPVITQPAISYEGELINTDNDRNLAVMANDLKAKEMVVLFEAPGLLENQKDSKTLIKKVKKDELGEVMNNVKGRMRKKVLGAQEAFGLGIEKIYWGDARVKNPISSVLAGKGTIIS